MNLKRMLSSILGISMLMTSNVRVLGMFGAYGSMQSDRECYDEASWNSDSGSGGLFGSDDLLVRTCPGGFYNLYPEFRYPDDGIEFRELLDSLDSSKKSFESKSLFNFGKSSSAFSSNQASETGSMSGDEGRSSFYDMSDSISLDDCGDLCEFNSEEVSVLDGVTGIKNYGNSCYLNALIQQLYRMKDFNDFISKNFNSSDHDEIIRQYLMADASGKAAIERQHKDIQSWILLKNLCAIFYRLQDHSNVSQESIDAVREILFGKEAINAQQDAHECMAKIFEMLDFKASNVVTQSELTCSRQHVKKKAKVSEALILNIADKEVESVKDALSKFFDPEVVAFKCESCISKKGMKTRQICDVPPDTLMITLSRFTEGRDKNEKGINPDEEIDLKEFCNEEVTGSTKYKLKGIVVQKGSLSGGHYISYVFENDKWYRISDDDISEDIDPHDSVDTNAYILRYEKISE